MNERNNCKNCGYSATDDGRAYACLRMPPVPHLIPAQGLAGPTVQAVSVRPAVRPDDWCGEWTIKPAPAPFTMDGGTILQS